MRLVGVSFSSLAECVTFLSYCAISPLRIHTSGPRLFKVNLYVCGEHVHVFAEAGGWLTLAVCLTLSPP